MKLTKFGIAVVCFFIVISCLIKNIKAQGTPDFFDTCDGSDENYCVLLDMNHDCDSQGALTVNNFPSCYMFTSNNKSFYCPFAGGNLVEFETGDSASFAAKTDVSNEAIMCGGLDVSFGESALPPDLTQKLNDFIASQNVTPQCNDLLTVSVTNDQPLEEETVRLNIQGCINNPTSNAMVVSMIVPANMDLGSVSIDTSTNAIYGNITFALASIRDVIASQNLVLVIEGNNGSKSLSAEVTLTLSDDLYQKIFTDDPLEDGSLCAIIGAECCYNGDSTYGSYFCNNGLKCNTNTKKCVSILDETTYSPEDLNINKGCKTEDNTAQATACDKCIGQGGIWTAIGCVDVTPLGILTGLIRIAFGVMGGVALVQLIIAGLMYQSGQDAKIAEAKEKFKATLFGIALLVFSVLILRILGINVLDVIPIGSV